MQKTNYFMLLLIALFLMSHIVGYAQANVKRQINWPEFMGKQDMIWETLPDWYESANLGNGLLGLMIYKEKGENYIRLETGNCSVIDRRPEAGSQGPRLMIGHFALHPIGKITEGTMHLDLWNAEANAEIKTTEGIIHLKAFVHAKEMIMLIQTTTEGNEQGFRWEWVPSPAVNPRFLLAQSKVDKEEWLTTLKAPDNYEYNPEPEVTLSPNQGMSIQKLLGGGETAVGWKETTAKKGERTFWVNITHSFPEMNARDICLKDLNSSLKTGYKKLEDSHRKWWHNYYPSSFLTLPDGYTENFYWIQMYKLASATRGDRALIDNTGPWLTVTAWPNAWWNLNVQLAYWPLNASNRLSLAGSLENTIYNNIDQLRKNVPPSYQYNSLGLGRASNMTCNVGIGVPGAKNSEIGLLTWTCHNLWLIYRHKMDDTLLREKLYPVLKGAINYYLHFLQMGADGKLHLPMTFSPEYGGAEDCNFDLALLRWGCQTLLEITERLKISDPLIPEWKKVMLELTPYPADDNGFLIGKDVPYTFSHRHYSHLLNIYPLYLVNKENPQDVQLIEKSLAFWLSKPEDLRGFTFTGASSISAAIGKGDDALTFLNNLIKNTNMNAYTNFSATTSYRESLACPTLETPISGAQCIHDMLLQSWGGKIRIFPAVPDKWQNLTYDKFLAEGAFQVSASRKAGKTEFIWVRSLAGEPCVIVTDIPNPVFNGSRSFSMKPLQKNTYEIDLKKGEYLVLYPKGSTPDFNLQPIKNSEINSFGTKLHKK